MCLGVQLTSSSNAWNRTPTSWHQGSEFLRHQLQTNFYQTYPLLWRQRFYFLGVLYNYKRWQTFYTLYYTHFHGQWPMRSINQLKRSRTWTQKYSCVNPFCYKNKQHSLNELKGNTSIKRQPIFRLLHRQCWPVDNPNDSYFDENVIGTHGGSKILRPLFCVFRNKKV